MSTSIVARPAVNESIQQAISGLLSELQKNSAVVYKATIYEFLAWATGKSGSPVVVVSNYIEHLRDSGLAASTINKKRVAIRRFFEWMFQVGAIDQATLSGIKSVKSVKSHGGKAGHWLTLEQLQCLLDSPDAETLSGRRDRAMLALLMGCALRRAELCSLTWGHIEQVGSQWAIVNLKRKHNRTQPYVAVPEWVRSILDAYAAGEPEQEHKKENRILVSYDRHGNRRNSIAPESVYRIVKQYSVGCGFEAVSPHDLRRSWARAASKGGVSLTQIQAQLGHESVTTTQKYIAEIIDLDSLASAVELEV